LSFGEENALPPSVEEFQMLNWNSVWVTRFDGRVHVVKTKWEVVSVAVYVDGVLAYKRLAPHAIYPRELFRFHKDGHEYVFNMKGYTAWFASLELRVDGLEAESTTDEKLAALISGVKAETPPDSRTQRFELVETTRIERPLGEDRKVIDNLNSSAPLQRKITTSKEWSQTITLEDEKAASQKGEAGGTVWGIGLKVEAEARIREKYATSTETKRRYSEEVTVEVRAKTKLEVVFLWKQVWQCGIVRVHTADGAIVELPYRLCLEPTFDQRQVESSA
jgi:hypothetical protein